MKDSALPARKTERPSHQFRTFERRAAAVAIISGSLFLALLVILHVLEPEFNPIWRFVSEYELGPYGWMMRLAFFCLGCGCVAVFIALRTQLPTTSGKVGLSLLLAAGASLFLTALFAPDPVTVGAGETTRHGSTHSLASVLAGVSFALAATMITRSWRRDAARVPAKALHWIGQLPWMAFILTYATLFVMTPGNGGKLGPGVWIGWPTRLLVVSFAAWTIAAACPVQRL